MTVSATRFWLTPLDRPFSTPNPAVAGVQFRTWRGTPTLRYPNLTFRAPTQLVRRSHRSMMHAAQSRPRDLSSVATPPRPWHALNVGLASEARSTGGR